MSGHGIELEQGKRHKKFVGVSKTTSQRTTYPVPAHNGEKSMIPDVYIRGLCRAFGLDEDEVREAL